MTRSWWLALFAWLPIMLGVLFQKLTHRPVDPAFFDLSLHTRLLVALPAFFLAERLVEASSRSAVRSLLRGGFCPEPLIEDAVRRGERLRDLWWPELLLAGVAALAGQLVLWRITGPTGVFSGVTASGDWTLSRIWYAAVALPLGQFVMMRWLWRWLIWSYILFRLSRLPLKALATHPDQAAGLACVGRPMSGFAAYAFGLGSVLSGAWGTQLLRQQATLQEHLPALLLFLLAMLAMATVPLLPFCGHLYRARRRTLAQYGDFADAYTRGFHQRWVASGKTGTDALGSPDIQSLNDLLGTFSVISGTRLFVFGMRSILAVCAGAALPMLPLAASLWTLQDLIKGIFSAILGGLPI